MLMSSATASRAARAAWTTTGLVLMASTVAAADDGAVVPAAGPPEPILASATVSYRAPALSFEGRYVAYLASSGSAGDLQLRRLDLSTGRSVLLTPSVAGGVAVGQASRPVISNDGTRVAFVSTARRLVDGDTNGLPDAFVRDVSRGTTLLASASAQGGVADGETGSASLSRNGRYVVFISRATDVVAGSALPNRDVYRRDLDLGTTTQVTLRPDGAPSVGPGPSSADVSGSGELVAFTSLNQDLLPTDDVDRDFDLYLRDLGTGRTRWLSQDVPAGANPDGAVISPNGRWVTTRWSDGSLHLTRVRDGATSTVTADGYAESGAFSARQGRLVYISGLRPFVRDLATGVDTAIPVPEGGSASSVTVSGDGRFAAFDWTPDVGGPTEIFRVAL